jgi:hypothetical protein
MANPHILRALGQMAQQGGSYFGQLHIESLKSRRKQEASQEAERILNQEREWQVEDRKEAQAIEDARYQRRLGDQRDTARLNVDYQMEQQDAASARRSKSELEDTKARLELEQQFKAENPEFEGLIKIASESGDTVWAKKFSDGSIEPTEFVVEPSGSKGGGSIAEKQYRMRYQDALTALNQIEAIEGEGYDPTDTKQRTWDNVTSKTDFTNWLASDNGQAYSSASTKIVEAFLRTNTGAAAPEPEQDRYQRMLMPQAGDSSTTVANKRQLLEDSLEALGEAGGYSDQERRELVTKLVDDRAKEAGFYEGPKESSSRKGRREAATPVGDDADAYVNKYLYP